MAIWRARIVSFLAGSGLTAIAAFGVLRQDLAASFQGLSEKVRSISPGLGPSPCSTLL